MRPRRRIRLSAMEITLLGLISGLLALAFLQARQEERRLRLIENAGDGH